MPPVEIDFMGLAKTLPESAAAASTPNTKRASLRDIQKAVSRMNPEILRSVIASGGGGLRGSTPAAAEQLRREGVPVLPSATPSPSPSSRCSTECQAAAGSMTIFYGGKVLVLDHVQPSTIDSILKAAAVAASACKMDEEQQQQQQQPPAETIDVGGSTTHGDDLPLSRRKSLQRFLQKRQDRLTAVAPYRPSRSPL